MANDKIYDLVIVGGGPAGLTAGIYAGRGKLNTLIIEKEGIGSLVMSHQIDNYPGFSRGSSGKEIYEFMKKQALDFNCEIKNGTVLGFDPYDEIKIVKTDIGNFKTKYIIIAAGVSKAEKKVKGETKYLGMGVSYCATCDGAFTRDRIVSLVGKGDELIEEALFLTRYAKEVNIFVTAKEIDCSKELKESILSKENVKIKTDCKLIEILGNNENVEKILIEISNKEEEIPTDFVFLYLGTKDNTQLYGEFVEISKRGFIVTDENMKTRTEKMYAIGDIREKEIRQITTATNDGTIAATMIIKDILKNKAK